MASMGRTLMVIMGMLLLSGCVRQGFPRGPVADAAVADAAVADVLAVDSGAADLPAAPPDAAPDLALADLALPDQAPPDQAPPDQASPDLTQPDLLPPLPDFTPPPPPDLAPPPPDSKPAPPVVSLLSPGSIAGGPKHKVPFSYQVTSALTVVACRLVVNGKIAATQPSPGSGGTLIYHDVPDGSFSWTVTCEDNLSQVGSAPQRSYNSYSFALSACKQFGWLQDTKYKLTASVKAGTADCMVINTSGARLDGKGFSLISGKSKDLVFHRGNEQPLTVLRNQMVLPLPTGVLWAVAWTSPYKNQQYWSHLNAADLDDDGDLDLISPVYSGPWRVFANNGVGSYGNASTFAISGGMGYHASRVLDLDGDGKQDFFVTHDGGSERFYRGVGMTSGFAAAFSTNLGVYTHNVDLGDFNRDGKIDVVTSSDCAGAADCRRHMRFNALVPGGGTLAPGWISTPSISAGGGPTLVADFNGDNFHDMLLSRAVGNDRRSVLRTNGAAGKGWALLATYSATHPAAVVDLDQDNDTDLVLYTLDSLGQRTGVRTLLNDGKAKMSVTSNISMGSQLLGAIAVGDVTGDGAPDMVLGMALNSGKVLVLRNNGGKSWSQVWLSTKTGATRQLYLRDLDHDGDLDLLLSRSVNQPGPAKQELVYLENNGAGVFSQRWSMAASGNVPYTMLPVGDTEAGPAVGLRVLAPNVTVRDLGAVRGFTTGVEVSAAGARLTNITVQAPDLHGVWLKGAGGAKLDGIKVRQLHQGVGLRVNSSSGVNVSNSSFCPAAYHPTLTVQGGYCVASPGLGGTGNRMLLNNGCTSLGWDSCY